MADVSKAQKLASARKKFKELKKEKKKNSTALKSNDDSETICSAPVSREQTPIENITTEQVTTNTQLPNYFNTNAHNNNVQEQPVAFFDTFINPESTPTFLQEIKREIPELASTETPISEEVTKFQEFDSIKFGSSVETLQQLSNEMAELIQPDPQPLTESPLEKRNQELAALLEQEQLKTQQLNANLHEYQLKIAQLEIELKEKELNGDNMAEQEISRLREDLQCHIQTVGILFAEKSELLSNLNQFQLAAKQKSEECEELQGRLKTSRSRVADLEREVSILKNDQSQINHLDKEHNAEMDKLRQMLAKTSEDRDEVMQDLLEVREKLKTITETNMKLEQHVADLSNQLSLANIKIQQLTAGDGQGNGQVEQLTQEKFLLEKRVADLDQSLKTLTKEREESSLQYQQYAQQLNAQLANLAARVEQLQKENESLSVQELNRVKHIGELEKQLQNLQSEHVNFAIQKHSNEEKEEFERLQNENLELQEENVRILNDKEVLTKNLEDKVETIKQLEELVEDMRSNQPDTTKLLAVMESDKIAAARAVSQNTEMKNQMESMQEVFMKLNNDKVELTEKLTLEQRNNKDLIEKLQKTELHLQTLADAIEIKDKELSHLRENSLLQSEQLTDRLRHYEAHDHSSHSLQNELQEAKQTIARLTETIENLKRRDSSVEEIKENVKILELKDKEEVDTNHNDVLDKESAMKHLEEKFLRTMEDIATLTEEKQRLEHLVLQLQSETETIGEYVALYQHQRSILKQKAIEKDQQLNQLANDREQIKRKLEKLNDLVSKLVMEKGVLPSELLEHHHNQNQGLCEEHAKIHNEINKIAQNNYKNETNGANTNNTETAEEIIALLSEIKTSNLVQPTENFHHCPWCSGQLIVV